MTAYIFVGGLQMEETPPIKERGRGMAKLRPTYAFVKRLELLSSGRLHLKDSIKVVTFTYNTHGSQSNGIR